MKNDHDILVEMHTRQETLIKDVSVIKSQQKCSTHTVQITGHDNKFKLYDKIFLITPVVMVIGAVWAGVRYVVTKMGI